MILALAGAAVFLTPYLRDWYSARQEKKTIETYKDQVMRTDEETLEKLLEEAREYNRHLDSTTALTSLTPSEEETYQKTLDISGTGIMGYLDIPEQNIHLPIYHGTDDSVLARGAGHLEMSSLPIGGEGSHSVITGHTGVSGDKLFDNLSQMKVGDTFTITVLNETNTYTVDQIEVVDPDDTTNLNREEGQDLSTLVTCTPYGVNNKRLLIRGSKSATSTITPTPAPAHGGGGRSIHTVQTGDTTIIYALLLISILSGIAAVYLLFRTGRSKKN